ncbi:hypothetical protein P0Y35_09860 [Kiritimatiellaeota bacterium B1221]|nr:hypothetical protein [Kiritimatiellaeota bacterium B1221]
MVVTPIPEPVGFPRVAITESGVGIDQHICCGVRSLAAALQCHEVIL